MVRSPLVNIQKILVPLNAKLIHIASPDVHDKYAGAC